MNKKLLAFIILLIFVVGIGFIFFYGKDNESSSNNEVNDNANKNLTPEENNLERNDDVEGLKINIDGIDMSVTLEDNETVKALLNKLPLEFVANELNGNEKYYYLDEDLPSNSQSVHRIEKGDIMLFGTDCLVIFYESFDTPYSYTRIGKIDDSSLLDNISSGSSSVSISK